MPPIKFPTTGKYERSPCRERLDQNILDGAEDRCKGIDKSNVTPLLGESGVLVDCPMDSHCNAMRDYMKDVDGIEV